MSKKFLKLFHSDEVAWLANEKPNALILLYFIAENAREYDGHPDGLLIGQCHIGNLKRYGLTQQEYRTAKKILVLRKHIKIIETSRTRKKSIDGTTTPGTLVQIISPLWEINPESHG
jgi:hypothetical protein